MNQDQRLMRGLLTGTVLIGGPFATLSPEAVRADCDILVWGEIELIASELFADLQRGRWQAEYVGG